MALSTFGDIQQFADAVLAKPEAPDVEDYLVTLGLDQDERGEVKACMAELNSALSQPTDAPAPSIVDEWL